jgi:hypothetical protein
MQFRIRQFTSACFLVSRLFQVPHQLAVRLIDAAAAKSLKAYGLCSQRWARIASSSFMSTFFASPACISGMLGRSPRLLAALPPHRATPSCSSALNDGRHNSSSYKSRAQFHSSSVTKPIVKYSSVVLKLLATGEWHYRREYRGMPSEPGS